MEQWNRILWSDETWVTSGYHKRCYVTRKAGEEVNKTCLRTSPPRKGGWMFWGSFHASSKGPCVKSEDSQCEDFPKGETSRPHGITETFPRTATALRTLMRCQITTFPFENLAIHYSPTHVVNIRPEALYEKMIECDKDQRRGKGGYCMEVGIFFDHVLRGLGFWTYTTGVRNRMRRDEDGIPGGEALGW